MILIPADWMQETNVEIARRLGVSTTAVLNARRRQTGRCLRCKRRAQAGSQHCATHRKAVNRYNRTKNGHKPWRLGGKGRPPRS